MSKTQNFQKKKKKKKTNPKLEIESHVQHFLLLFAKVKAALSQFSEVVFATGIVHGRSLVF